MCDLSGETCTSPTRPKLYNTSGVIMPFSIFGDDFPMISSLSDSLFDFCVFVVHDDINAPANIYAIIVDFFLIKGCF